MGLSASATEWRKNLAHGVSRGKDALIRKPRRGDTTSNHHSHKYRSSYAISWRFKNASNSSLNVSLR